MDKNILAWLTLWLCLILGTIGYFTWIEAPTKYIIIVLAEIIIPAIVYAIYTLIKGDK